MNDFDFIPDKQEPSLTIPYFEDARADFAPYYSSTKSLDAARSEIVSELVKLDAVLIGFQPGHFLVNSKKRYGFIIRFLYSGKEGLIRVAGLPIRNETANRIAATRLQALLNVRDWLKALVTQQIFTAGASPLLSHLLVNGDQTVGDYILSTGKLLPAPDEIVEGHYTRV